MREKRPQPSSPAEPQETLGDRMTRLRRAKRWGQQELADRSGARAPQISKYERGSYSPPLEVAARIAEALETSLDYLVTGREPKAQRDSRLRDLLPALEALPQEQRDNAVEFLIALVNAHRLLSRFDKRQADPAPRARTGRRSRKSGKLTR